MHTLLGEIPVWAPAGWDIAEMLPQLVILTVLIVAFGLIYCAKGLVDFINWTIQRVLSPIPLIGRLVSLGVSDVLQPLSNALGSVEQTVDRQIGSSWHKLARFASWAFTTILGSTLVAIAVAVQLAQAAGRILHIQRTVDALRSRVATAEHDLSVGIDRARTAEAQAYAGIDQLLGQIEAQAATLELTVTADVAGLRERATGIEDDLSTLWRLIEQNKLALGETAFAAAVATALAKLDLSWTRCSSTKRVGKALCGIGPQLIEDLLALGFDAMVIADLCEIVSGIVYAAGEAQPFFDFVVKEISGLIDCQGVSRPPVWEADHYAPPTSENLVTL